MPATGGKAEKRRQGRSSRASSGVKIDVHNTPHVTRTRGENAAAADACDIISFPAQDFKVFTFRASILQKFDKANSFAGVGLVASGIKSTSGCSNGLVLILGIKLASQKKFTSILGCLGSVGTFEKKKLAKMKFPFLTGKGLGRAPKVYFRLMSCNWFCFRSVFYVVAVHSTGQPDTV